MRNLDYFKNKKVVIIGLARSGLCCANLLYDLGAQVSITDNKDDEIVRLNKTRLKSKDIGVELGRHRQEFIKSKDIVVVSPGVSANAYPLLWAKQFEIPVISEIELAWVLCPSQIIAVTGSNGKTTVTTLIGKILEASGKKVFVCGNIGNPFSGEVEKMKVEDFVSLEVSSFQLETIQKFRPKISVILNLSRNHMDRYNNMREYLDAKKRIFLNQDETDYAVLNAEDSKLKEFAKEIKANVVYFSQKENINPNQAAVLTVGSILGLDNKLILNVFKDFKGIEHRLEYVGQVNNIRFINDSKATTADSALWALKNIPGKVVLIAGGRHKGVDYSIISDLARQKVREAILIGEAKEKIAEALAGVLPIEAAQTLEEAVQKAYLKAVSGDHILFSPMCSSFDMFSNYEERGNIFKNAVYGLINKKS